jgi:hypothetical protein
LSQTIDEDGFDWETMSDQSEEAPSDGQPSEAEADDGEATAGETQRLRDEFGRFVSQEGEEEPGADEEAVAAAAERHGTDDPDKLLKIIADQTAYTRELQSKLDRLANAQEQQLAWNQQQAEPQIDYEELSDEDPAQAALTAYSRQDPRFPSLWENWAEEEPGRAAAWLAQQEVAQLRSEMQQQTAPLYAQNVQVQQQQAVAQFGREHPDVTTYAADMAALIEERPNWKIPLEQGPPDVKIQILTDAYLFAKARASATQGEAAEQVGQATAQATEQALSDAFVASASNAVRENSEPSAAELLSEGWENSGIYWGK